MAETRSSGRRLRCLLFVATSLLIGGRAPRALPPETRAQEDVKQVLVQVCVPGRRVAFEDVAVDLSGVAIETGPLGGSSAPQAKRIVVRRWLPTADVPHYWLPYGEALNRDGILSYLATTLHLVGDTPMHQPIYEGRGHRPQDYLALDADLEVVTNSQSERVKYWFKLPPIIPKDQFTAWNDPISREDAATRVTQRHPTFWNLTHKRPMEIHAIGEGAPRMRFKARTLQDAVQEESWRQVWSQVARATADLYPGVEREKRFFVPRSGVDIPGC